MIILIPSLRRAAGCSLLLLSAIAGASGAREGDPRVLMSREEAFKVILPGADRVVSSTRRLTTEARARVEKKSGRRMAADTVTLWAGLKYGDTIGYAFILDEIGLHHSITFGVGVKPDGRLVDCVVMVFRESKGSEIKDIRFRRQFHGKTLSDPIRLHRDIVHVTGATYSSRAAADAVRKALSLLAEVKP